MSGRNLLGRSGEGAPKLQESPEEIAHKEPSSFVFAFNEFLVKAM